MKKIIVPVDFSEHSAGALRAAADIARKVGAECTIHLVHVYDRPVSGSVLQFQVDTKELKRFKDLVTAEMDKLCNWSFMEGIAVKRHILADKAIWEFVDTRLLEDADLIVMGTHELKGWKALFSDTNAQQVVRHANCPVLVTKGLQDGFAPKKIVFASNFYTEAEALFPKLLQIFRLFDPEIHLLKINRPGNFEHSAKSTRLMEEFAEKFNLTNYSIHTYNDITVEEGIQNYCKKVDADLVSLETHGRTGLDHFFFGSIAEGVVRNAMRPVMSVRMEPKPKSTGVLMA